MSLVDACPLCGRPLRPSVHLEAAFAGDPYGYWFARLVTHYRHEHISYYDKSLHSPGYARRSPLAMQGYDALKAEVNERAKRQVIRGVLRSRLPRREKVLLIEACGRLEHRDAATLALMDAALGKLRGVPVRPEAPLPQ